MAVEARAALAATVGWVEKPAAAERSLLLVLVGAVAEEMVAAAVAETAEAVEAGAVAAAAVVG